MNILVVGSHPDDAELGCGGTIAKHLEKGDEVLILIMTNGERGDHSNNREECYSSLTGLGIKENNIIFANFRDANLVDNYETISYIEEIINKFKINRVYTHHFSDRHQDHRNCSRSVSSAARKIPELYLFQGPSTSVYFEPHVFIEISETQLMKKMNSLRFYKSQINKGIIDLDWIKSIASVNGMGMKGKYAEAFAINHIYIGGENV